MRTAFTAVLALAATMVTASPDPTPIIDEALTPVGEHPRQAYRVSSP